MEELRSYYNTFKWPEVSVVFVRQMSHALSFISKNCVILLDSCVFNVYIQQGQPNNTQSWIMAKKKKNQLFAVNCCLL